ncbi:MAG: hypothetical protein DHS20C17_22750 [Cyclobacteriaceae bacterium]|nr:MAG: hypothetical protein DHS20C17_22750 [Cyclobacteriaceae bacterium]
MGYVYHQQGRVEESHQIFEQGIEKLKSRLDDYNGFAFLHISRIYAFQGKRKEALKYLSEYAKRGLNGGWLDIILIDPFFEGLRDDPEFRVIVKRAQEEKAAIRTQIREMEEQGELML